MCRCFLLTFVFFCMFVVPVCMCVFLAHLKLCNTLSWTSSPVQLKAKKALREVIHTVNSLNHHSQSTLTLQTVRQTHALFPADTHSYEHILYTNSNTISCSLSLTHTRTQMHFVRFTHTHHFPSSPWWDVAALLHEGSQGEPEGVEDAKLIGRLVSGALLCCSLLWFLCMPLIRAEATHLKQWRKNMCPNSFRGLQRKASEGT